MMLAEPLLSTPRTLLAFLMLLMLAACGGGGGDSSSSSAVELDLKLKLRGGSSV